MPNRTRYLFDSDVLITAKSFHYKPGFCPEFWDWIVAGHKAGLFYSIDKVRGELLNGDKKDVLYSWAMSPALKAFFLDSAPSIAKWTQLSQWANDPTRKYIEAAKQKFLNPDSADAWLVAVAAGAGKYEIVTNEVPAPESKRDIKLPDAAAALTIKCVSLHEILSAHAGPGFKFKP
jgi:hypothetical protein